MYYKHSFIIILGCIIFSNSISPEYALYKKAKEESNKGQISKSIQYYQEFLSKHPNHFDALLQLGTLLKKINSYPESIKYLLKAHKISMKDKRILITLIDTYYQARNFSKMHIFLKKSLKLYPNDKQTNYYQAAYYVENKNYSLAKRKLTNILKYFPDYVEPSLLLVNIHLQENNSHLANKILNTIDKQNNKNLEIQSEITKLKFMFELKKNNNLSNKNNLKNLINELKKNNTFNNNLNVNLLLGKIYALSQNCEQAESFFHNILKLNPQHFESIYYLGYCNDKFIKKYFPRFLEYYPYHDIIRYKLEDYLLSNHSINSTSIIDAAKYHYNKSLQYKSQGNYKKAIQEIRWSLTIFPDYINALKELMQHSKSDKNFMEVISILKKLKKLTTNSKYSDLYEQYIYHSKKRLASQEGINTKNIKTSDLSFVFPFTPLNLLGKTPDMGYYLAKRITFNLKDKGRVRLVNKELEKSIYRQIKNSIKFDNDIVEKVNSLMSQDQNIIKSTYANNQLKYAIYGSYKTSVNGIHVYFKIFDIINKAFIYEGNLKEEGRDYLKNISLKIADKIFNHIPFHGHILKINRNGVIINLGRREGLNKNTEVEIIKKNKVIAKFQLKKIEYNLSWGDLKNSKILLNLYNGLKVRVKR